MSKIIPNKPLLILLYSFPGAGKTYFARQLTEQLQAAHVQSDRIRYELFEEPRYDKRENEIVTHLMDYMTEELLNAGVSVIYDVGAMRLGQRRILRDMARKAHAEPLLLWLQIDMESAFARIAGRDRRRTDDKFAMPLDRTTFDDIASHMQNPERDEDYIVISGKHSFPTQLNSVRKRLGDLGLISVETRSTNLVKPDLVNLVPNPAAGRVDMERRNIVIR
jgi:predicted kinase